MLHHLNIALDHAIHSPAYGVPMFNKHSMPPVSTTAQCIVNLLCQFFAIYLLLALCKTFYECTGRGLYSIKVLETLKITLCYAPMLSCLFLATRMRAIMLSGGQTEKYNLPQPLCQKAMQLATWSVLAELVVIVLCHLFGKTKGTMPKNEQNNPDISLLHKKLSAPLLVLLNGIHYLAKIGVYLGFIFVSLSLVSMKGPHELWGAEGTPPVAPAVACTINLCIQFFFVMLCYSTVRMYTFFNPDHRSKFVHKLENTMYMATTTVMMAPMLSILFIGARMRALQLDPKYGAPQSWAQICFFICTYSVLAQTILCVIVPLFSPGCTVEKGAVEGDIKFVGISGVSFGIATFLRYCAILGMYGGFTAVMCSVFLIKAPYGAPTPPVSPALRCILNLCIQYFLIYLILYIAQTTNQLFPALRASATWIIGMMHAALNTVLFAPMLAVLFLIVRMRALQLTKNPDGSNPLGSGPQLWAQDCMFIATWALFFQVCLVVLLSVFYDMEEAAEDEDGNVKAPAAANQTARVFVKLMNYFIMIAMYASVVGLVFALFTMTPERLPPWVAPEHNHHLIPVHSMLSINSQQDLPAHFLGKVYLMR